MNIKNVAFTLFCFSELPQCEAYIEINNEHSQECGFAYLDMWVVVNLEKRVM